MAKEVPAFLRAEIGNDATDPTQEPQNRMLGRLAQMRLEFAEGQLDRVEVRRILRKINQCRARCFDRTMSDFHEALGCAALAWTLTPEQIAILVNQLSPASRFPPRVVNFRGETIISASGDAAAIAIGKVAQKQRIEEDVRNQIASIAAARTDLKSRGSTLAGLVHQWYGSNQDAASVHRTTYASEVGCD